MEGRNRLTNKEHAEEVPEYGLPDMHAVQLWPEDCVSKNRTAQKGDTNGIKAKF
jgi:hypothetical protein